MSTPAPAATPKAVSVPATIVRSVRAISSRSCRTVSAKRASSAARMRVNAIRSWSINSCPRPLRTSRSAASSPRSRADRDDLGEVVHLRRDERLQLLQPPALLRPVAEQVPRHAVGGGEVADGPAVGLERFEASAVIATPCLLCPQCQRQGEALAAEEDDDHPRPPASGAMHPDYPEFAASAARMLDDELCAAIGVADAEAAGFGFDERQREAFVAAMSAEVVRRLDRKVAA